ncbi:VWA domain-containing protein [bacterium]|nr:VWA domain-containing protein [bacterium]
MNEPQGTSQIIYEFSRTSALEGWWAWALITSALAALLYLCVRFYRRDVQEMPTPIRILLIGLRLVTVLALVFFFFDLQRRTERMVTRPSEVAILVDTSQSMSLPTGTEPSTQSRIQRAQQLVGDSGLLEKLSSEHRVSVYAFGDESEPRLVDSMGGLEATPEAKPETNAQPPSSAIAMFGAALIAAGLVLGLTSLALGAFGRATIVGWWLLPASLSLMVGTICLGSIYSIRTEQSLTEILGLQPQEINAEDRNPLDEITPDKPMRVVDWGEELAASGTQSRIGDAVRNILTDHDPSTLAGIVLISDGQNNGGTDVNVAMAAARRSQVSIYPIGLGSSSAPTNVRIVDIDAPRRIYPGDKFAVSAVLQGSGENPLDVEVQLLDGIDSGPKERQTGQNENKIEPPGEVIDSQKVRINNDGTLTGIRFELEPEAIGRRRLAIRIVAPEADNNERDDIRDARYEVVGEKLKVLVVAGGPTREYRFVRNMLYRDNSIQLDAWLQTGQPGISQDADNVLQDFPSTADELFKYDTIALFDPNWLDFSAEQLNLLDRWLTQQAGGMIIVAGPVYHPEWKRRRTDPRMSTIAGFYPLSFTNRPMLFDGGRQGGSVAWPLKFTPEARRAEFLWIADTPEESESIWNDFSGVYDFVDSKSAKAGAKVYALFADPTTEIGGSLPIYLASQFYGAGKVYFQGSGEMWRLRAESDAYFDTYYTKLVRWVSEGRLLRDSTRGVLLVDNSKAMIGDTIVVRAVLVDEKYEPLDIPEVPAKILSPNGRIDDINLQPLKGEPRAGTYGGRFIVRESGSYELRLTLGDALNEQVLRQSVQVRLPTVELERPRRNDQELEQYATITNGVYLPLDPSMSNTEVQTQLAATVRPQPQATILPGTPNSLFNERRNVVLMWLIATMLTMEWVIRRLHRLA